MRLSVPNGSPAAGRGAYAAEAEVVERLEGVLRRRALREDPAARMRPDEHVLEHRHVREEHDVLERARDAEPDDLVRALAQDVLPSKTTRPESGL